MRKYLASFLLTAALGGLTVAALFGFNRLGAPYRRPVPLKGGGLPDSARILAAITTNALASELETIASFGSRGTGSEGGERAALYVIEELRKSGYDIVEQPFDVVVPVTRYARILDAGGNPVPGVRIHPMRPNRYRTCTTPPAGLTGTVYAGEKGLAREFQDVDVQGNFVLLPVGVSWNTMAGMGARAILYAAGTNALDTANWAHSLQASIDVPRFYVEGDTNALVGKQVTLLARVDYEPRRVRNILGFLRAEGSAASQEALVLLGYTDAQSYVPDLAPGGQQACNIPVVLNVARALAEERAALRRHVVVVFTAAHVQALAGVRNLITALGTLKDREGTRQAWGEEIGDLEKTLATAEAARLRVDDAAYWDIRTESDEESFWARQPKDVQTFFGETFLRVLDWDHMDLYERQIQERIDWMRAGMPVKLPDGSDDPRFVTYGTARVDEQVAQSRLTIPLWKLKADAVLAPALLGEEHRQRIRIEADRRLSGIRTQIDEIRARQRVADRMADFERLLILGLDVAPGAGKLAMVCGDAGWASRCLPADAEVSQQILHACESLDHAAGEGAAEFQKTAEGARRFENLVRAKDALLLGYARSSWLSPTLYFDSFAFLASGYTAFTLTTLGDSRSLVGTPEDKMSFITDPPESAQSTAGLVRTTPIENLTVVNRILAVGVARLSRGHGQILPVSTTPDIYTVRGQVLSQVGKNLTPNQLMPGSLVRLARASMLTQAQPPGVSEDLLAIADWDSRFAFPGLWVTSVSDIWSKKVDLDAGRLDAETGEITWSLSLPRSGVAGAYAVQGVPMSQLRHSPAGAVIFRASPIEVFPMPNPATMRAYDGIGYLEAKTVTSPKDCNLETAGGASVCFVPPDTSLFFTFMRGSKNNAALMEIGGFALNAQGALDSVEFRPGGLPGAGYFVADHPRLTNIELDVARSMAQLNHSRVRIQDRYNMADRMVLDYDRKSRDLAESASAMAADGKMVDAKKKAFDSVAYSSNIHPVIRQNASDAITGILFYLLLAIPFSVFLEKLLVGHPDLRVQLLGQGIIFLLFFLALRAFHPAYQLVRSSYMILLGFITFALAVFVGGFVSARFSQNVGALHRRLRQEIETSDVSRAGAAATAFLLGLNNLRKRPVRTALTMMTLVLVTFVMICFASISTDVQDIEFPVGKAAYNGLMIRDRLLRDVGSALPLIEEVYGEKHVVAPRAWAGSFTISRGVTPELAEYVVSRTVGKRTYESRANGVLGMLPEERMITDLTNAFPVMLRWFEDKKEKSLCLSRTMADELQVTDAEVLSGEARVAVGGQDYTVLGVFDEQRVDAVLDLDGESLMPIDIVANQSPQLLQSDQQARQQDESEIPEDFPRLPSTRVLIAPLGAMPAGAERTASIAVKLQGVDYPAARAMIGAHLEKTGVPAYYGLDGIGFYGGKFRMRSLQGFLDLFLPVLIAALTVLNTMRGSVYERRNELFVFNAVGLAPNHIRFLFLAEASVYAVVGVVGGYLLAQGVGSTLKALDVAKGLTINYSSMSAVLVSVVIMGVVYVSSLFPARMAAQLAAPSETMTRKRQMATSDVMELELPFTFNRRDRVGIVPYFVDWFENYGEGSAGEFFCSPPECEIRRHDGYAVPYLRTTTWLKPYDLGVSQTVELVVRHDARTGDNVATVIMTRKSGDLKSWERCCHGFIGLLRKRFLTWRAVTDADRDFLLDRGRKLLDREAQQGTAG